jgi:ketosteroid isomerase-like protein
MRFLFVCILSSWVGIAIAQSKKQQQLLAIDAQRYKYMIAKDTSNLSALIAPSVQYIHSNGLIDTKQSLLQSIATGELIHKQITTTNNTVRIYRKNTAIITGEAIYNINYKGKDMTLNFVYTNVYYKLKGHWLLVHRHTCKKDL